MLHAHAALHALRLLGGSLAGGTYLPTANVKVVIALIPNGFATSCRVERPHCLELAPRAFPLPIGDSRPHSDNPTMPIVPEGQILFAPAALTSVSNPGHSRHPDASELVKRERVPCRRSGRGVSGCHRPCSGSRLTPTHRLFCGGRGAETRAPSLLGGTGDFAPCKWSPPIYGGSLVDSLDTLDPLRSPKAPRWRNEPQRGSRGSLPGGRPV
jgi:hypothetical protein